MLSSISFLTPSWLRRDMDTLTEEEEEMLMVIVTHHMDTVTEEEEARRVRMQFLK